MRTETAPTSPLDRLSSPESDQAAPVDLSIELSPPLVLAAALVYMMAANGEIDESERSQLQSVIGKNKQLLECAVDYVKAVPFDQFLRDAPAHMGPADKLSVLTNVCDSMMSDGYADEQELDLLHAMTISFGLSDESFEPYYQTIAIKNNKTVLGPYEAHDMDHGRISPHLALAVCLIYMMASDGSLGPEEIGRLQALIGEFEGLQKVAVKHALKVKSEKFLALAAQVLEPQARLFVLANVADIMLSDSYVEPAEKKLFGNMLAAFDITEEDFKPHYRTITTKNIRSFSSDDFEYVAAGQPELPEATYDSQMGATINQTMRDNIVKVAQGFGSSKKIDRLARNSAQQSGASNDQADGSNDNYRPRARPSPFGNSDTGYPANTGRKLVAFKRSSPVDLPPPSGAFAARSRPFGNGTTPDDHDTLTVQSGEDQGQLSVSAKSGRRNPPRKPLTVPTAAQRERAKVRLKGVVDTTQEIRVEVDELEARRGAVAPVQNAKTEPLVTKPAPVVRAAPVASAAPLVQSAPVVTAVAVAPVVNAAPVVQVVQVAPAIAVPAPTQAAPTEATVQAAPNRWAQSAVAAGQGLLQQMQQAKAMLPPGALQLPSPKAVAQRHSAVATLLGGLAIAAAASIFAGMAVAALVPTGAPPSLRTTSLEPCWLASALSKQSARPHGDMGCWQAPQPRSVIERAFLRNLSLPR